MRFRRIFATSLAALVLMAAPRPALADGFITPYLGTTFNGSFDDYKPGTKLHYGVGLGWLGQSGIGFEVDAAYAPTYLSSGDDSLFDFENDGSVVTVMGNLVVGRSAGGIQPYVSGGMGLMRTNITAVGDLLDYTDTGFGINAGAGLRIGSGRVALRGDLRYFRQLSDLTPVQNVELGSFSFWRASAGVSIGF